MIEPGFTQVSDTGVYTRWSKLKPCTQCLYYVPEHQRCNNNKTLCDSEKSGWKSIKDKIEELLNDTT